MFRSVVGSAAGLQRRRTRPASRPGERQPRPHQPQGQRGIKLLHKLIGLIFVQFLIFLDPLCAFRFEGLEKKNNVDC
jgi:hypothetical protein